MDYAFINVSICRKEGKNGTVYFPDHFLHFMEFPPYTKRHYNICWQVAGLCRHLSENGFVLRLLKTEQLTLVMSVRLLPYTYAEHKVNSSPTQSKLTWLCAWTVEHTHRHTKFLSVLYNSPTDMQVWPSDCGHSLWRRSAFLMSQCLERSFNSHNYHKLLLFSKYPATTEQCRQISFLPAWNFRSVQWRFDPTYYKNTFS